MESMVAFNLPTETLAKSGHPPRITSVHSEAVLANFDRDAEPDGLDVVVVVVNHHGEPEPVHGNLEFRLIGERRLRVQGRIVFEELQRWTRPLCPFDFVDGQARFVLPFGALYPERDFGLRADALLNVRLGVYGSGNYEMTTPVAIRTLDPFRDRLQLYEGSRFFRDELTGEVRSRRLGILRRKGFVGQWNFDY